MDSVEIFRGPQSTIQGRNALAGAIVARTIEPTFDYSGAAQFSYADYDTIRASAAFSGPIVADQLAFRIAADYASSDGFIDNPTLDTDESDADETITARAKLLLTPQALPGFSATASYSYIDAEEGEGSVEDDAFPQDRVTFEDVQTTLTSQSHIASLELTQELGDRWSLTAITGYIDTNFLNLRDVDRGDDPLVSGLATDFDSNDEILSQEVRANYSGDRFEGFVGGYYFDSQNQLTTINTTVAPTDLGFPTPDVLAELLFGPGASQSPELVDQASFIRSSIVAALQSFLVDFERDATRDITNYAVFGEGEVDLTGRLSLTFGARYDSEEVDQSVFDSNQVRPIPPLGDPTLDAMIAFTGAFLGIVALLSPIVAVLAFKGDQERLIDAVLGQPPEAAGVQAQMLSVDELARLGHPQTGASPEFVVFHNWGDQAAVFDVYYEATSKLAIVEPITISGVTGEAAFNELTAATGAAVRVTNAITPLHYATFGGVALKVLYFVLGLALAVITAMGSMMWIERRLHGKEGTKSPRFYRALSRLTVGVTTGIGVASVAVLYLDKFYAGVEASRILWVGWTYFAVWAAVIAYAFVRRDEYRTTRDAIAASGVGLLGLPVVNGVVTGDALWRGLGAGHSVTGAVDLGFVVMGVTALAIAFALPARRADRKSVPAASTKPAPAE